MLRVLDLFSGIGGFSLGLERTGGFQTVAFCEIESFPRKVLAKHWPGVPIYGDVRELTADALRRDGITIDVICGGFPCQDISFAGAGAGIEGERSGLWSEFARLIGELRPQFVIVENVAALLGRGLDRVLGDLAEIGYDAEWHCIPASAVGAPHRRDRLWIVADADFARLEGWLGSGLRECASECTAGTGSASMADAASERWHSERTTITGEAASGWAFGGSWGSDWWLAEPDVGRVAHGVPDRAHRLKALGNAVVPQIPELIGNAILQSMRAA